MDDLFPKSVYKGSPISGKQLNTKALCVVHATKYEPQIVDGTAYIRHTSDSTHFKLFRNSVHVALNHRVGGHMMGSWDDAPYTIIGSMDDTLERMGKPSRLNTVDTWWALGAAESLQIPHATLVKPGEVEHGLYQIAGNTTTYKAGGYTADDIAELVRMLGRDKLLYQIERDFAGEESKSQKEELTKLVTEAGTSPLDPALSQEALTFITSKVNALATERTIQHMGYDVQPSGTHAWANSWDVSAATRDLAEQWGIEWGPHNGTDQYQLEKALSGSWYGSGLLPLVYGTIEGVLKGDKALTVSEFDRLCDQIKSEYFGKPGVSAKTIEVAQKCLDKARSELQLHEESKSTADDGKKWGDYLDARAQARTPRDR